jgi:hypothetical protein
MDAIQCFTEHAVSLGARTIAWYTCAAPGRPGCLSHPSASIRPQEIGTSDSWNLPGDAPVRCCPCANVV